MSVLLRLSLSLALWLSAGAAPLEAQAARPLFAAKETPVTEAPVIFGRHANGCLVGAVAMPESGPSWQTMRLSRNHNWGHPETIRFLQELSRAAQKIGWQGLYIGDISQPRGGPVPGHASHQIGLDADIWLLPPQRLDLSRRARENISSLNVRAANRRAVNGNWTAAHHRLIATAARDPRVNRIFITAPVKIEMCREAGAADAAWLRKVRPWWGHNTHFHVRLNCPRGQTGCTDPAPLPPGDGCEQALWWVTDALAPPDPNAPKPKKKAPLQLADMPRQCTDVLRAP